MNNGSHDHNYRGRRTTSYGSRENCKRCIETDAMFERLRAASVGFVVDPRFIKYAGEKNREATIKAMEAK